MQPIHPAPENTMICPECGSKNVQVNENVEVTTKGKPLKHYSCKDCNISFIPAALTHGNETKSEEMMEQWSKKVRMSEGNNTKSWTKPKQEFIIIRNIK